MPQSIPDLPSSREWRSVAVESAIAAATVTNAVPIPIGTAFAMLRKGNVDILFQAGDQPAADDGTGVTLNDLHDIAYFSAGELEVWYRADGDQTGRVHVWEIV